jgi:hypothetical protein
MGTKNRRLSNVLSMAGQPKSQSRRNEAFVVLTMVECGCGARKRASPNGRRWRLYPSMLLTRSYNELRPRQRMKRVLVDELKRFGGV